MTEPKTDIRIRSSDGLPQSTSVEIRVGDEWHKLPHVRKISWTIDAESFAVATVEFAGFVAIEAEAYVELRDLLQQLVDEGVAGGHPTHPVIVESRPCPRTGFNCRQKCPEDDCWLAQETHEIPDDEVAQPPPDHLAGQRFCVVTKVACVKGCPDCSRCELLPEDWQDGPALGCRRWGGCPHPALCKGGRACM